MFLGHLHTFALSPGAGFCASTVFEGRMELDRNVAASLSVLNPQNTVVLLDGGNNDPVKTP